MPMNPIETREAIRRDYIDYLSSILTMRSKDLTEKARQAVAAAGFTKGPFLESTPPFSAGLSLEALAHEGIISKEFETISEDVHYIRNLYKHQEAAIRKICAAGRNVVVATGTGSGKTECYLFPILNELIREKEEGTLGPGVRAILLFPMNALANDQVKKIRTLLRHYPDITFGRYTGETSWKDKEQDARQDYLAKNPGEVLLDNEMFTRKRMQDKPPHILLTNYAMLEYLLLRPEDSSFFDRHDVARFWKFVVLDEAHTYRGAAGTEIAYLLRRLKERIYRHTQTPLRCIATSATLGNESDAAAVANFASNIFGEPFSEDDIITSTRIKLEATSQMRRFMPCEYTELKNQLAQVSSEDAKNMHAYLAMREDMRVVELQDLLIEKPKDFNAIADELFRDIPNRSNRRSALADLVELAAMARPDANTSALLPARYHLFARSLEGLFASFYPDTRVYLDRRESELIDGDFVRVFELANCKRCAQEYIAGITKDGILRQVSGNETAEFYLVSKPREESIQLDEDDFDTHDTANLDGYTLCTHCGTIVEGEAKDLSCCSCKDPRRLLTVYRLNIKGIKKSSDVCAVCGTNAENVITQFITANQAATYTLANSLYRQIPPKRISLETTDERSSGDDDLFAGEPSMIAFSQEILEESGRKLLVFSDNRQEAAFFAGYMHNHYNRTMWQLLMLRILEKRKTQGATTSIQDLNILLCEEAEKYNLYEGIAESNLEKQRLAACYVMREFLNIDAATGLEGRGYISFTPKTKKLNNNLTKWGLGANELWLLICAMMDTLRKQGASNFPEHVSATDDFFIPRNHPAFFSSSKSTRDGTIAFIPTDGRINKRSVYVHKLMARAHEDTDNGGNPDREVLEWLCKTLLGGDLMKEGYVNIESRRASGICYTVNFAAWNVEYIGDDEVLYRCNRCGKIYPYSIKGVCPEFRCDGTLVPLSAKEARNDPYYSRIYHASKVLPMVAKEHTAQLTKDAASDYQKDFEEGKINVLSCSTTFEMGVDVGELEAILLRNVPPETANYIQRAGRAGRRASSAAFSLTFARRNSHDLNFYRYPEEMISGKIYPPYIEIDNEKLAGRHIRAIVLAWFFKKYPELFQNVQTFIGGAKNGVDILREELSRRPEELLQAIRSILSPELFAAMRVEDWRFADDLILQESSLCKAVHHRSSVLELLIKRSQELYNAGKGHNAVDRLVTTYSTEGVIPFLSSNGVLPKHGFPIDVVSLDVLNNTPDAKKVDLSRDLSLAVGEYAPPSQIVANGKVWTSRYVNTMLNKGWPAFRYYECAKCGHISPPDREVVFGEQESQQDLAPCPICNHGMHSRVFIIPQFGFSTSIDDKPKPVGDSRPPHGYTNRVQFCGIEGNTPDDQDSKERMICGHSVTTTYASKGKLMVVNNGNGNGLWICEKCGHMIQFPPSKQGASHNDKYGRECHNKIYKRVSLGHTYLTDILRISLPRHMVKQNRNYEKDVALSVLYAMLDGAADTLSIARTDIDGCIDYENGQALILFDTAVGGAGHVKKIGDSLALILNAARKRVDGSCGCTEETSCYGCLRNYANQHFHDKLTRGGAKEYLCWLLDSSSVPSGIPTLVVNRSEIEPFIHSETDQTQLLTNEWRECIAALTDNETIRSCANYLAARQALKPSEIGLDLTSPETGEIICEAEMVWRVGGRLIALLTPENATFVKDCSAAGILTFVPDREETFEMLLQAVSGGMSA